MLLYLNCYVLGEGYTLKRTDFPDLQELAIIRRRDMPDGEAAIFSGAAAPHLFLGTVENRRFGCVRDIETALKDENGRRCFIHIALEAETQETELVDAVLMFALRCRGRFVSLCNRMVTDCSGDYHLDAEAFRAMLEEAQKESAETAPAGILIPQTSVDDFFAKAGQFCEREGFSFPFTFEEWKSRDPSMDLFLYCSTPSSGFVLSWIDTISGEKLHVGKAANDGILPWAQSILTCSGAAIALFEQEGKICLVGRDIQSAATDQYGRRKKMSLVLQAPVKQSLPVRQLAAWALVDFAEFSEQLTACVKVYDGPRGYEVQGKKLSQMLEQVSRQVYIPEAASYRALWEQVSAPPDGRPFLCLVCEATLGYFCRSCGINIKEQDVRLLLNGENLQDIRKKSARLAFVPELYVAPAPDKTEPVSTEPEHKAAERLTETEPAAIQADRVAPKVETASKPVRDAPVSKETEPVPQRETVRPTDSMDKPLRETSGFPDEERIDLLQQKWFWPAAIGILALLLGGVVFWFRSRF